MPRKRGIAYLVDKEKVISFIKSHPEEIDFELADKIAERRFLFCQPWDMEKCYEEVAFPGKIDWEYKFHNDPEWMWMLSRQRYLLPVVHAYVASGEKKYIHAVLDLMEDWLNTQGESQGKEYTTWRTLDVGLRLKTWVQILEYIEEDEELYSELLGKIKVSVRRQIMYLLKRYKKDYALTNWRILEYHGVFIAAAYFQEFVESKEWMTRALEIIEECLELQITADGFHWEQSYMYHVEMLLCTAEVIMIAERNDIEVPARLKEIADKMVAAMMHMVKPNRTQLCYGDSDEENLQELFGRMALLFRDGHYKYFAPENLTVGLVSEYGSPALELWNKIPRQKPEETDYEHPDVGNYFARSGWGEEDSYLFFKNGFIGSGHGHCDLLHVDIISRGEPILVDSGRYTYRSDTPDRQRFKCGASHNTLLVDGEEFIVQDGSWDNLKLATAIKRPCLLNRNVCFLQGAHLGYMDKGVFVNRKIIYIKPDIWIIVDEAFTNDKHGFEQHFTFASDNVKEEKEEILYRTEKQRFRMIPCNPESHIVLSDTEVSPGYNKKYLSKKAIIKTTGEKDVAIPIICIAEGNEECCKVDKIPVLDMNRKEVDSRYVSAWKITRGNESFTVVTNHKEEDCPRRQIYIVDEEYVYARTAVFHKKEGKTQTHILEY